MKESENITVLLQSGKYKLVSTSPPGGHRWNSSTTENNGAFSLSLRFNCHHIAQYTSLATCSVCMPKLECVGCILVPLLSCSATVTSHRTCILSALVPESRARDHRQHKRLLVVHKKEAENVQEGKQRFGFRCEYIINASVAVTPKFKTPRAQM